MTPPMSLFILSVLLTQGSSSPILSELQGAYLDQWTLELNPAHQTSTLNEQNEDHNKDEMMEGNIQDNQGEDIKEIDEDSTESVIYKCHTFRISNYFPRAHGC